jgi:hypothetical protein
MMVVIELFAISVGKWILMASSMSFGVVDLPAVYELREGVVCRAQSICVK